jgi:arginine decarboxylase
MTSSTSQPLLPRFAFLTKGAGTGAYHLEAFDGALRAAGVADQNLVPVSSVFPPGCKLVSRDEGVKMLQPGQITFCVMARAESNELQRRVTAALGIALPVDVSHYGYIAEHHAEEQDEAAAKAEVEALATTLLAAKLGVDPQTVKTRERLGIAQSAQVEQDRHWTSAITLCVFIL